MNVTLSVLADCANITEDGKLNIMGVFGEINPPELPFALPMMYLVLGFSASPSEIGSEKDIIIILMDGEGRRKLVIESKAVVPPPKRSGSPTYIQTILGLAGCKFEHEGVYDFAIQVNGEEKTRIPLRINTPRREDLDDTAEREHNDDKEDT